MKGYKKITVDLPKGFMNVGITIENNLVADTNNSQNWDDLRFPLPKGKWRIHSYNRTEVTLIKYAWWYFKITII